MASVLCAAAAVVILGAACARESDAQGVGSGRLAADDTASVALLLSVARGIDPLLCELLTRNVDQHGSWSRWGPLSGNPLDADSAGARLLSWIQRDHGDPAVVPRLTAAMRDGDRCVRRIAGSFLGRVRHPSATAALLAALDEQNADTRYVAALGLGLSEHASALQPLIRRLADESSMVRRAAAWSLGSLENKAAIAPLIELLARDSDPRVRQAAAWALGQISG